MRAATLLTVLLLGPPAGARTVEEPGAERPPERPPATEAAPQSADDDSPEDRAARPAGRPSAPPAPPVPQASAESAAVPPDPAPPAGPPQRELLRESDFDFSACLLALQVMGARYEVGNEITGEQRDCGIARPVTLIEALPGLMLDGAPQMRCETARTLGWWLRGHVLAAASRLPGAPRPVGLAIGTAYDCRGMVSRSGDPADLSEHAFGNALDIAAIRFDAGPPVEIAQSGGSDMYAAFIAAIRGTACLYFTTVLGPGANAAHETHLHLDIKKRRDGYRICD